MNMPCSACIGEVLTLPKNNGGFDIPSSQRNSLRLSCRTAFTIGLSNSCKTELIPPSLLDDARLWHINASIIQGSGLGPSKYVVSASDLHPVHEQNRIAKFADDTYIIIPSSMRRIQLMRN